MTPAQTKRPKLPLFDEVRNLKTLTRACDHVLKTARWSNDPATKAQVSIIESDRIGYLRQVQRDLRGGNFEFEPQHGALKHRRGKEPRPLVIAPLRSRVVHRAILDVCLTERSALGRRLGNLPNVLATPTSVGGLPGKGVKDAIALIRQAISTGATHYIRSDLKAFFANLPKAALFAFLDREVQDDAFVKLFKQGLETELANAGNDDIHQWWSLFPFGETGVPQGSALSALSANIVLSDFDRALNGRGITTVRYLDDFLILGPSARAVGKAWANAERLLTDLRLTAHQPGESEKAAKGRVEDGFDFLAFHVDDKVIAPSRSAKLELVRQIDIAIRNFKRAIKDDYDRPRRAEDRFVQSLSRLDGKIRGWGHAFGETTQRITFRQLDVQLSPLLENYIAWFLAFQARRSSAERRRMWGIALLADTPPPKPSGNAAVVPAAIRP